MGWADPRAGIFYNYKPNEMETVKTKKYELINGKPVQTGEGTAMRDDNGVLYRDTEDYLKGITAQQRSKNEPRTAKPVR